MVNHSNYSTIGYCESWVVGTRQIASYGLLLGLAIERATGYDPPGGSLFKASPYPPMSYTPSSKIIEVDQEMPVTQARSECGIWQLNSVCIGLCSLVVEHIVSARWLKYTTAAACAVIDEQSIDAQSWKITFKFCNHWLYLWNIDYNQWTFFNHIWYWFNHQWTLH